MGGIVNQAARRDSRCVPVGVVQERNEIKT